MTNIIEAYEENELKGILTQDPQFLIDWGFSQEEIDKAYALVFKKEIECMGVGDYLLACPICGDVGIFQRTTASPSWWEINKNECYSCWQAKMESMKED